MKHLTTVVLMCVLLALLLCFTGCEKQENAGEEEQTEPDTPLISQPTEILRSDTANGEVTAMAVKLRNAMKELGHDIPITTDWVGRNEEVPPLNSQIVVGLTNRALSEEIYDSLRSERKNSIRDWSISESGGSVLIVGATDQALADAVDYFIENCIDENGVVIHEGMNHIFRYPYKDWSIDGVSLLDFGFAAVDTQFLAGAEEYIRSEIETLMGTKLSESSGKMITLGLDGSLEKDGYRITANRNGIEIAGATFDAAKYAALRFIAKLGEEETLSAFEEKGKLPLHTPLSEAPKAGGSYTSIGDPVYLIEDANYVHSGWDYRMSSDQYAVDASMSLSHSSSLTLPGSTSGETVYMTRPFLAQTGGKLLLETSLAMADPNGLKVTLSDSISKKDAVVLTVSDRIISAGSGSGAGVGSRIMLRVSADLDAKKYTAYCGSQELGTFDFTEPVTRLDSLTFALTGNTGAALTPVFVYLSGNEPVSERFLTQTSGEAPIGFDCEGDVAVKSGDEIRMSGKSSLVKSFEAFDGKAVFEFKFNSEKYSDTISFAITEEGQDRLTLDLKDYSIMHGSDILRFYDKNFWYTLRIEADTRNQYAEVLINGKSLGYFPLDGKTEHFDGLRITSGADDVLYLDDIFVHQKNDYDDYCPAPLSSGSEDGYYVGLQSCSLWRNGHQWGWDCITPFDDIKPVLGYYDEGNPELADWETKYMVEHGVDYELYCWYSPVTGSAIKNPIHSDALHRGYFNSKYSDSIRFAFMWENANGCHPGSSENFRNYIVPYWVEYYLSDPRYMVIDNKPLITVFSPGVLIEDFGSPEAVQKEFDYVREVCRGLGFDGAYILVQSAGSVSMYGADATYSYNWGKANTSASYIASITDQYANGKNNTVPTISVGFNNIGWHGTRSDLIAPDDYRTALKWAKYTFNENYSKDSWLSKAVILSTWNEYGEGTYIMPAGIHGFDYLDAVHDTYAPNNAYENIIPTEAQKARIGTLYLQDREILRAKGYETSNHLENIMTVKEWDFSKDIEGWGEGFSLSHFTTKNGTLKGSSSERDFAVMSKYNLGIDLTGVKSVEITMKCSKSGVMELFFITDSDREWTQGKSFSVNVEGSDDYITYVMNTEGNKSFTGKLRQLRIDPLQAGCSFEISSVRILGVDAVYGLSDGVKDVLTFDLYKPYYDGGCAMVPFDPHTGIVTYLGCTYGWNGDEKTLTLSNDEHTVSFTIGSGSAVKDGNTVALSRTVDDYDGLPVIALDDLGKLLDKNLSLVNIFGK